MHCYCGVLDLVCGRQQLSDQEVLCLCCSNFPALSVPHVILVKQLDGSIHVCVTSLERSDLVPLVQQLSLGVAAILTLTLKPCLQQSRPSYVFGHACAA